jgi:hypothetical protein
MLHVPGLILKNKLTTTMARPVSVAFAVMSAYSLVLMSELSSDT